MAADRARVPAWELAERCGIDLPTGRHWLTWYLAALNGEHEHDDWKARRDERVAKQGGRLKPAR